MPRGWEDFWGRVRRVQYPTVIGVSTAATDYRSDAAWYTRREFEKDLEFNAPTGYLQARVSWAMQIHCKVTLTQRVYWYGRVAVLWNDLVKAYTPTISTNYNSPQDACFEINVTQDAKIHVLLDGEFWKGKLKTQFQLYVSVPAQGESRIAAELCKVEVAPYQW